MRQLRNTILLATGLEIMDQPLIRGVAPHMRDQAAYLTPGGRAEGRPLGSIFLPSPAQSIWLERNHADAILLGSDGGRPLTWHSSEDEGELPLFDNPTMPPKKAVRVGTKAKPSVQAPATDGFAV
jgi:hypothetical protein